MTQQLVNPLVARFSGELVLIEQSMAPRFDAAMAALAEHEHSDEMLNEQASCGDFWPEPGSWRAELRPYVVDKGILQIPVKGMLLHDFPWAFGKWATGYEYIQRAVERGCEDFKAGNIKGIALVTNSGGGFVAGLYDMLDKAAPMIREAGVPVRAFVQNSAYSAAYAVVTLTAASPQGKIVVNKVGGVGSIGTLVTHVDWSKWNERMGLTYSFIKAGDFKTDGNPEEPLSDRARKRMQSRVNEINELFIAVVAEARSLAPETVRGFEAGTFTASESLSNGLADEIGALDDALAAFAADLSEPNGDVQMTTPAIESAVDQAALDAARSEGVAAGKSEGATAERTRISAILACEEAQKRPQAAMTTAMDTDMSLDAARAFLAKLPEEAPAASTAEQQPGADTPFNRAMSQDNPDVGAQAGGDGQQQQPEDQAASIVGLARSMGLACIRPAPAA